YLSRTEFTEIKEKTKLEYEGTYNMQQLSLIDRLFADAREGYSKGHEEGIAEGILLGHEEGREKGREEGREEIEKFEKPKWLAENTILNILQLLKVRFGSVPMQLQNQLFTITDTDRLNSLLLHAATCPSLESFQQSII
ncbi:MAG: hypothetical protein LBT09_08795, partial [Planctomycetaceae bacterium]|nr:hypothetical protein [Planctomycetaceae bacterium]